MKKNFSDLWETSVKLRLRLGVKNGKQIFFEIHPSVLTLVKECSTAEWMPPTIHCLDSNRKSKISKQQLHPKVVSQLNLKKTGITKHLTPQSKVKDVVFPQLFPDAHLLYGELMSC